MDYTLHSDIFLPGLLTRPEKTVHEFLLKKASQVALLHPNKIFLRNGVTGEEIKVKDLEPKSRSVASALNKLGFKCQDIVINATENVTTIFYAFLGVYRLGGIIRSSYPEDTTETLLERIVESKARWILCDENLAAEYLNAVKSNEWHVHVICYGKHEGCLSLDDLIKDDGSGFTSSPSVSLDDPCLILCTSGTTGKSKGAILTHGSMLSLFEATEMLTTEKNRILPKSILMLRKPVHLSGSLHTWRALICGVELILLDKKIPKTILEAVDKYRPEIVFGVPTFLQYLVEGNAKEYNRDSIKIILARGCTIHSSFMEKMRALPNLEFIHAGYALTENSSVTSTFDFKGSGKLKEVEGMPLNSIGRLFPNSQMRILDVDTREPLGPGKVGEISVKSCYNIKGYWNLPEATKELFVDGFLLTGDLGYYDSEGYVYFQDRLKETFKYFGNHVSPSEIEAVINEHPAVKESCVFGIPDPNGGNTIPKALVILKPGCEKSTSANDIKLFAERKLASYKHLRGGLLIVAEFPIGKTGKVVRKHVAESISINNAI